MKNYSAKTVDAYIVSAAAEARPKLKELRKLIKSTIPNAEEKISWGVPFYWHYGALAGFTPVKSYVLFGLVTRLQNKDRENLLKEGYKTGKKTVQIKFDQKVPTAVIKRILKAQAKMNKAKKASKLGLL